MKLREWLESVGSYDVVEGNTTIRTPRQSHEFGNSAYYFQDRNIQPGCRAYSEGERKYTTEAIYVVGLIPKVYWNEYGKVAFTMAGDTREWYIAGWGPAGTNWKQSLDEVAPTEYHPFGHNFLLHPWPTAGMAIDAYRERPYRRVNLSFEGNGK